MGTLRASLGFSLCAAAFAQYPAFVFNPASNAREVAPGSIAVVQLSTRPNQPGLPLVDPRAAVVEMRPAGSQTFSAIRVLAQGPSPASVLVLIPPATPVGEAEFRLTAGDVTSFAAQAPVSASSFGLFEQERGSGSLVQNIGSAGAELNALTRPARPGQFVTLWGTGLGLAAANEIVVAVGGIDAAPSYAGPAPGFAGLDQINVRIPEDAELPESCYVAIEVRAGGRASNPGRIAIARDAGACKHPLGLSAAELAQLDGGAVVFAGAVDVSTAVVPASLGAANYTRSDEATATFFAYDAAGLSARFAPAVAEGKITGCRGAGIAGVRFLAVRDFLKVGDSITLRNEEKTAELALDFGIGSRYTLTLPPPDPAPHPDSLPLSFFDPGAWTLRAPGSDTVRPFEARFRIPGALRITNFVDLQAIDRTADAVVRWDASPFRSDDILYLTLSGAMRNERGEPSAYGVSCRAVASAGEAIIPLEHVARFTPFAEFGRQPALQVSVERRSDRLQLFGVPLRDGRTVPGAVSFHTLEWVSVSFR